MLKSKQVYLRFALHRHRVFGLRGQKLPPDTGWLVFMGWVISQGSNVKEGVRDEAQVPLGARCFSFSENLATGISCSVIFSP